MIDRLKRDREKKKNRNKNRNIAFRQTKYDVSQLISWDINVYLILLCLTKGPVADASSTSNDELYVIHRDNSRRREREESKNKQ